MAPLSTSHTYNFQSIEIELLIREAFENIGIFGEFVESQKLDSARRSIDFLLLEWMNKSVNLWTLKVDYITLYNSKIGYSLSQRSGANDVSDIIQVNLRTSSRQLNGVPASSAGVAANAFDGDPDTFCDAGANGWISYDYGVGSTQKINFVGLQSNLDTTDAPFPVLIETSNDNVNWTTLYVVEQPFSPYVTYWFDINQPINARIYRARAIGGGTLSLVELYFNNNLFDFAMSEVSRYEYLNYPNKMLEGRPSFYYVDRQINPILYVWPAPSILYNCLQISYKRMIQDSGSYTNTLDIPSRFYPALVAGLTWKLAIKFNPQLAPMFQAEYEKSFNLAAIEDSENAPISIRGDTSYEYNR